MTLADFLNQNQEVVQVVIRRVAGSSPREVGAGMYVSMDRFHGTIGGGQLEYMALDQARALLVSGSDSTVMDVPLGPEIGQCCGGRVGLDLAVMRREARAEAVAREAEQLQDQNQVLILGAGHVGRALARALAPLPVRALLVDSRAEEIGLAKGVETCLTAFPEAEIGAAGPGAAFVIATHDHALDFLLAAEALARGDAAYVGMIGSKTKRARFESWARGHASEIASERLICPMGRAGLGDKRPEVIAAFVATELISSFAEWQDIRTSMESAV